MRTVIRHNIFLLFLNQFEAPSSRKIYLEPVLAFNEKVFLQLAFSWPDWSLQEFDELEYLSCTAQPGNLSSNRIRRKSAGLCSQSEKLDFFKDIVKEYSKPIAQKLLATDIW